MVVNFDSFRLFKRLIRPTSLSSSLKIVVIVLDLPALAEGLLRID